jgi:hypothetical protein
MAVAQPHQPTVTQHDTTNNSSAIEPKVEIMVSRDSQGDDSMEDCEATGIFNPMTEMADTEVMNNESQPTGQQHQNHINEMSHQHAHQLVQPQQPSDTPLIM